VSAIIQSRTGTTAASTSACQDCGAAHVTTAPVRATPATNGRRLCPQCQGRMRHAAKGSLALVRPPAALEAPRATVPAPDGRVTASLSVISAASFDLEIRGATYGAKNWLGQETRRRRMEVVGEQLSNIWSGDSHAAAQALGFSIELSSREEIFARTHVPATGTVDIDSRAIFVASDLDAITERRVVAHELAHSLFTEVCRGGDYGEECAHAFSRAWALHAQAAGF
jgi:hypothetical protein